MTGFVTVALLQTLNSSTVQNAIRENLVAKWIPPENCPPLLDREKKLLNIIVEEQREYHSNLYNQHKKPRVFDAGNLVILRKQVHSDALNGKPARLAIRA
jgi:hypothetical protein